MIIKKLIAVLITALTLTLGCAGTGTFFSGDPTVEQALAKIAIQQATLRAIQADGDEKAPARAAAVVNIVDQAQEFLTADDSDPAEDQVITAAELANILDRVLPDDITPADKLLVTQLSLLVVAEVEASIPIGQQNLPVGEISAVLDWVREAAVLIAPTN